jgi:Fe-S-cluster containining protein
MFEKYYNRLRYSQKLADRSLVECIKILESNRNYVFSSMKDKKINCQQGCNLCCHCLTLKVDTLSSYILFRVFKSIPYDELFPYYKKCADNRIIAMEYIDELPVKNNQNVILELYNKYGFTAFTCPFVDKKNGCLIHDFNPQICFSYFSSVPCKIVMNPELSGEQKIIYETSQNRAEIVEISGLENDSKNYYFGEDILKNYEKFNDLNRLISQDKELEYYLSHSVMLEMMTIISMALETSNQNKYNADTKGLKVDLLASTDGKIEYIK